LTAIHPQPAKREVGEFRRGSLKMTILFDLLLPTSKRALACGTLRVLTRPKNNDVEKRKVLEFMITPVPLVLISCDYFGIIRVFDDNFSNLDQVTR